MEFVVDGKSKIMDREEFIKYLTSVEKKINDESYILSSLVVSLIDSIYNIGKIKTPEGKSIPKKKFLKSIASEERIIINTKSYQGYIPLKTTMEIVSIIFDIEEAVRGKYIN